MECGSFNKKGIFWSVGVFFVENSFCSSDYDLDLHQPGLNK